MSDILFVSCTRGRKENTKLFRSLSSHGLSADTMFFENNSEGLPACYNRALSALPRDTRVVFAHDDVAIADDALAAKLDTAFQSLAVVGVAGSAVIVIRDTDMTTRWHAPPWDALSGTVWHQLSDAPSRQSYFGFAPRRCVSLDGLFLAIDRMQAPDARFDEQFAFHFYDLDFCLQASRAGIPLGTAPIPIIHASEGDYRSPAFFDAQRLFRAKWHSGTYFIDHFVPAIATVTA